MEPILHLAPPSLTRSPPHVACKADCSRLAVVLLGFVRFFTAPCWRGLLWQASRLANGYVDLSSRGNLLSGRLRRDPWPISPVSGVLTRGGVLGRLCARRRRASKLSGLYSRVTQIGWYAVGTSRPFHLVLVRTHGSSDSGNASRYMVLIWVARLFCVTAMIGLYKGMDGLSSALPSGSDDVYS